MSTCEEDDGKSNLLSEWILVVVSVINCKICSKVAALITVQRIAGFVIV